MLLRGAFDWILLVIEVMECSVVVSDKVIFFLFGIYKIVDQPGWQNLSPCFFCHKIGEPVDKSLIVTILQCRWCCLLLLPAQCPKNIDFDDDCHLATVPSNFESNNKFDVDSLIKAFFDYFLVVCEFHENVEFSIAPRWLEIDQVIEISPRRFFI